MKNLNKIVHLFLQTLPSLEGKDIIVGYSGGADSTALLDIMQQKKDYFKFNLKAVFFSHEGSPLIEDESTLIEHCKKYCDDKKIDLIVHPLFLTKLKSQSWESSGRMARMEFYENKKPDYVFLGHHKDDQNETTMIQLFRGAGRGIAAMKKVENFYCRPFLDNHKTDIYDYLNYKKLKWIEDSTNNNLEFTRNFWRKKGLPTIESYYPVYSQQLDLLREKTSELNQMAKDLAQVDGLDKLIDKQSVDVSHLSDLRLKNLVSYCFAHKKISIDKVYVEAQIKEYKNKGEVIFEKKDQTIFLNKGYLNMENLQKNLKNKPKKI